MLRPLKLAIIGGGPSSFYCASRILSRLPAASPEGASAEVHIYDRLWAPHGLVRYGVAPDHPEVKNCTHKFDQTALDGRFRFFGNVDVSDNRPAPFSHCLSLPLASLIPHYSHLIISSGAYLPYTLLSLSQVAAPALSLVHWYTAHPSSPTPPPLSTTSHLTLIGHGNVSLDIARMLLSPQSTLTKLDIPLPVLDVLSNSAVKHISIASRRGPAEAAFTAKELRELLSLPNASMVPIDPALLADPPNATRQQSRILSLLRQGSAQKPGTTDRTWSLEFFRSPVSVERGKIEFGINTLDENRRAVPTGATETRETDWAVESLGYRSEPTRDAWFDGALGRTRNERGRVLDQEGRRVRGVYTSGWASNGAKGVLATTMMDAYAVAETLLTDHFSESVGEVERMNPDPRPGVPPELEQASRRIISYECWKKIDAEEIRRGQALGKERERMLVWSDVEAFLS